MNNRQQNQVKDVQPIRNLEKIEDMKWALKRHCTERDYILFILGINVGLRVGDMLKLKVKDVKKKKRIVIKEGKTGKPREVYLLSIYDELNEYISTLNSDWLFPSRKGDKAISPTQAYRQLNKAANMADIESMGNHTLRKTFSYWFYKKTLDIVQLQEILNHSHPSITLRYAGIRQEELEDSLKDFKL